MATTLSSRSLQGTTNSRSNGEFLSLSTHQAPSLRFSLSKLGTMTVSFPSGVWPTMVTPLRTRESSTGLGRPTRRVTLGGRRRRSVSVSLSSEMYELPTESASPSSNGSSTLPAAEFRSSRREPSVDRSVRSSTRSERTSVRRPRASTGRVGWSSNVPSSSRPNRGSGSTCESRRIDPAVQSVLTRRGVSRNQRASGSDGEYMNEDYIRDCCDPYRLRRAVTFQYFSYEISGIYVFLSYANGYIVLSA